MEATNQQSNDPEDQQQYEARLRRRLVIFKQQMDAGKVSFAPHLAEEMKQSLAAIRYQADGEIDLSSVDGRVRATALAITALHDRAELKDSASLSEVQYLYFDFIEQNFGEIYRLMQEKKISPHDTASLFSRRPSTVKKINSNIDDFLERISFFWTNLAEVAHAHVEDMSGVLKGVFGGDLFPSESENIASKCGIYADTLVLPDPFLRSILLFPRWSAKQRVYYFIKHGLNLLQYRELACASVSPPIVVVLPDWTALDDSEREYYYGVGVADALTHASRIFNRAFSSLDELEEFAITLDTIEKVERLVADRDRVLFATEWPRDLKGQLTSALADKGSNMMGIKNPGLLVAFQAIGRMSTSNELLGKSARLHGTPIIDAPTSWQYLAWKLEYDSESFKKMRQQPAATDLHILRGLQSLGADKMEWLGRIPPAALIELRRTGAMSEIRSILSRGINEIASADPQAFNSTTSKVLGNIHHAFNDHRKKIAELSERKWKFAKTDVASWIVTGSLAVTAAATGVPYWGIAAIAADQLLSAPKLKDIPKSISALAAQSRTLHRSPVGLLFKYGDRG